MEPHELACHYLTQVDGDLPADLEWLSARERDVLSRLHVAGRRRDWLLGRWTAKRAIASRRVCGAKALPLALVEILAAPDGAPEVFIGSVAAPYRISISHRAGRAMCAVTARDNAIGCDLELVEPHDDALAEDFFTADELAVVRQATGIERDRLVAVLWSAKESALKLLREGLRLDTRAAEVVLEEQPDGDAWAALVVECPEQRCLLPGWWRRMDDVVLTIVSAAASEPPLALLVAAGAAQPANGAGAAGVVGRR